MARGGISPYAVCLISALLIGFAFSYYLLIKSNIEATIAGLSCFMNVVFVMIGGKLYTLILNMIHGRYSDSKGFLYTFAVMPFASIGGMLGMLVGIEIFNLMYNEQKNTFRTIYILMLPLLYAISKIGCQIAGCCGGINGIPVQLIEVISFGLIFLYSLYVYLSKKDKKIVLKILIICSIAKFSLQFLRIEHLGKVLDANQVVCLIILLASVVYIFKEKEKVNG